MEFEDQASGMKPRDLPRAREHSLGGEFPPCFEPGSVAHGASISPPDVRASLNVCSPDSGFRSIETDGQVIA